jgi:hypothetical protein
LRAHIDSLQKQLKDKGIDPIQAPAAPSSYAAASANTFSSPVEPSSSWATLQQPQAASTPSHVQREQLKEFRTGCIGDNYLGVSSGNSWLSPIEGTSLSLFGATLDLAEFIPEEQSDSGTSYQNFLDHAFVEKQKKAPQLPAWETGKVYAEWYFRSIQPMLPILHKPDFMKLLHRVYHENYQCTAAELVMVHMVMSLVSFQYNTRNTSNPTRAQNFQHWHFSLSLVPRLIKGHTLEDMQGLTLICAQLRAFPRPGACWMFTNTVLGLAIELGLHRSVTAWQAMAAQQDPQSIEMRKRIFWSLMLMHVPVSGKLGRPMPLRLEDFDIEIPEEAHDYLPEESDLDEWRKCSFRSGKWGFVLLKVQMKVYSSIYSIGSMNANYDTNVRQLEAELKETVAKFPPELSGGAETKDEDRVTALYLQLGATGCQLLIHHPALCRSLSPQVMSNNLDACLDASNKMLSIAMQLKALNSLDSTLYWNMDFLASMFTMLFVYNERRDRLNMTDLDRLRQSMKGWLDVMAFVGSLLGTGNRLHVALCPIVEWSMGNITRHLQQKTATAAVASTATPPATDNSQQQSQQHSQKQTPVYENGHDYPQTYSNGVPHEIAARSSHPIQSQQASHQTPHQTPHHTSHQPTQPSQQLPQQPLLQTQPQPQPQASGIGYPNGQAYSYADTQGSSVAPYNPAVAQSYNPQGYAGEDVKPNMEAQLAHAALAQQQSHPVSQPSASNYMPVYQTPTSGYSDMDTVGPMAWRSFTHSINTVNNGMHTSAPGMGDAALTSFVGMLTDPMGNVGPKNSAFMYTNGASFGQMQMPPLPDGNNNVADWPLIQY